MSVPFECMYELIDAVSEAHKYWRDKQHVENSRKLIHLIGLIGVSALCKPTIHLDDEMVYILFSWKA